MFPQTMRDSHPGNLAPTTYPGNLITCPPDRVPTRGASVRASQALLPVPPDRMLHFTHQLNIDGALRCSQVGKDCRLFCFLLAWPAWRDNYALPGQEAMPG